MEPSLQLGSQMDHHYIDRFAVAERYLNHSLTLQERAAFESHLVDCQECTDRILLAEMFQNREANGLPSAASPERERPGLVLRLKVWQIAARGSTAALVLAAFALAIRVFLR
jgi:hypothetical protein